MKAKYLRGLLAVLLLLLPAAALADSITPSSVSTTLGVGDSAIIKKTVTVSEGTPTGALVDVFFLSDTTGSMGSVITSVQSSATNIMTSVAGLGSVAFGAGEYKDVGDSFVFKNNANITTSTSTVQAGINTWSATGGGDYPEAGLYALKQVADTTSWRTGSSRILVWFGDAPSQDPAGPDSTTQAGATSALNAKNIKVQAINVGTGDSFSPTGGIFTGLNDQGQASAIATATGGAFFTGISDSTIVDTIKDAITSSFDKYTIVTLDLSEVPAGVGVSINPLSYSGTFDRSTDRLFDFDLTFMGLVAGDYSFNIYALVDGGRVAIESDRITVREGTAVPEPATLLLIGFGLLGLTGVQRRMKK